MAQKDLNKIGGWLLVFIIWVAFLIVFAIFSNGNGLRLYYKAFPELLPAGWTVFAIVCLFYGFYAWCLYGLIRRGPGILFWIRLMILLTPLLNGLLPGIFAAVTAWTVPELRFNALLADSYGASMLASTCGSCLIAAAWFYYFRVSKRVKAIWT